MKKKVLVVEDDTVLARVLRDNLGFEGYDVRWVSDGSLVTAAANEFGPDLVLLDMNLPGTNGFDVCCAWSASARPPIIALTARAQKADKVRAFRSGVDDYVTKPFDMDELMARINAVLRRTHPSVDELVLGNITVDFVHRTVARQGREIELTHREFELLHHLALNANKVVQRDDLLRAVWGYSQTPLTRAVDHAIVRLRKKVEPDPGHPRFIHTVHGDGYYLAVDGRPPGPSFGRS
jgi:DNA-binding response OmpR family regulator